MLFVEASMSFMIPNQFGFDAVVVVTSSLLSWLSSSSSSTEEVKKSCKGRSSSSCRQFGGRGIYLRQ